MESSTGGDVHSDDECIVPPPKRSRTATSGGKRPSSA